ncbi:MAG: tRNA (guanosine(37)-N1)-methyltransferase TrmD [Culicoidibacterales bacterium]
MKIDILSLFPEMFQGVLHESILKRAQEKGEVSFNVTNFRDYTTNKHKKVDDYPYGGGAGMVLTPQPIFDAVADLKAKNQTKPKVILMTPQGRPFTQKIAEELAQEEHLILVCGHYEGFDERIVEYLADDELSIGDYVLTGGELAAMVITDAVVRLLDDVIEHDSHANDSFSMGTLEYPHYTRPADYEGMKVPDILLSGHHKNIEQWRREQALIRTKQRRPDLLDQVEMTSAERQFLVEWQKTIKK